MLKDMAMHDDPWHTAPTGGSSSVHDYSPHMADALQANVGALASYEP